MTAGISNRAVVAGADRHSRRLRVSGDALPIYKGPFGPEQAERLLWRAGFGPRPGEVTHLATYDLRRAVLSLTRPARVTLEGPAPVVQDGQPIAPDEAPGHEILWWLDRMVRTTAPLIERMTLIWHDWFATSYIGVGSQSLMIAQNQTLRRFCLGNFGELLREITVDPAMLVFLSGVLSKKDTPNENYAREMQELFTLGVNGGYSERDVREQARALTGWTCTWNPFTKENKDFRFDLTLHDPGVKVIYGHRGRFGWRDSVRLALAHSSHPGHFVRRLWSYFSPEPLSAGDARTAERLYVASKFQIRPVVEAMLMHPLVYEGPRMVKPPIVQIAGMLRAIGRYIDIDSWIRQSEITGQMPFYPPNVAGWEASRWLNTGTWLARFNLAGIMIDEQRTLVPRDAAGTLPAEPNALLEKASAFWASPTLSDATRAVLLSYARTVLDSAVGQAQREQFPVLAVNGLRTLVVASPDYHTS